MIRHLIIVSLLFASQASYAADQTTVVRGEVSVGTLLSSIGDYSFETSNNKVADKVFSVCSMNDNCEATCVVDSNKNIISVVNIKKIEKEAEKNTAITKELIVNVVDMSFEKDDIIFSTDKGDVKFALSSEYVYGEKIDTALTNIAIESEKYNPLTIVLKEVDGVNILCGLRSAALGTLNAELKNNIAASPSSQADSSTKSSGDALSRNAVSSGKIDDKTDISKCKIKGFYAGMPLLEYNALIKSYGASDIAWNYDGNDVSLNSLVIEKVFGGAGYELKDFAQEFAKAYKVDMEPYYDKRGHQFDAGYVFFDKSTGCVIEIYINGHVSRPPSNTKGFHMRLRKVEVKNDPSVKPKF